MNKEEIKNLIKELIEKTTISVKEILIEEGDAKTILFSANVSDPYFFTSHNGEALFALNNLIKRIIEAKNPKKEGEKQEALNILIDINGFQKKRIENIHAIAHMMAERARYFKSSIEVEPMSAFERRVVHEFLANETDLKTESEGVGPNRRVIIKYTGCI